MLCDKCGKEVEPIEDATLIEAKLTNNPFVAFFNQSRHIQCSPSRAQYIIDDNFTPVFDNRPEFDKRLMPDNVTKRLEYEWTQAYKANLANFK